MTLSPHEEALIELLRSMGSEPLHVALTSTGDGVVFTLVVPGTAPVTGWGDTVEDAFGNAYSVPEPEPRPQAAPRFTIVAGTDRQPRSPRT